MSLFDVTNAKKIANNYKNGNIEEGQFVDKALPILQRNTGNNNIKEILAEGMMNAVLSDEIVDDGAYEWAIQNGNELFKKKFLKKVTYDFYQSHTGLFTKEAFPEIIEAYTFNPVYENGLINIEDTWIDALLKQQELEFLMSISNIDIIKTIQTETGSFRDVSVFDKKSIPIICSLIRRNQDKIGLSLYVELVEHGYRPTLNSINENIIKSKEELFLNGEVWKHLSLLKVGDYLVCNNNEEFSCNVLKGFLTTDVISTELKCKEVKEMLDLLESDGAWQNVFYTLQRLYYILKCNFETLPRDMTSDLLETVIKTRWAHIMHPFLAEETFSDYDVLCTYLHLKNFYNDIDIFGHAYHRFFKSTMQIMKVEDLETYKKFMELFVGDKTALSALDTDDIKKLLLDDNREIRKAFEKYFPPTLNFIEVVPIDYTPVTHNFVSQLLINLTKENALDVNNNIRSQHCSIEKNIRAEAVKRSIMELFNDKEMLDEELAREDNIFKNEFVENLTEVKDYFDKNNNQEELFKQFLEFTANKR